MKLFVNFRFSQKTAFFSTEVQDIITLSPLRVTIGQEHLGNSQIEQFKAKNMGYMVKFAKMTISQLEPAFSGLYTKNDYISTNMRPGPNFVYQNDHQGLYYWNFGEFEIVQKNLIGVVFPF